MAALEAKRASTEPVTAQDQGRHYAEQLEVPYVFLSNGEEVWFLGRETDAHARKIAGFHSQDDLERRIASRQIRRDLIRRRNRPADRGPRRPDRVHQRTALGDHPRKQRHNNNFLFILSRLSSNIQPRCCFRHCRFEENWSNSAIACATECVWSHCGVWPVATAYAVKHLLSGGLRTGD